MSSIVFLIPRAKIVGSSKGDGQRGITNCTIALAEALAARGHHVECIGSNAESEYHNGVLWHNQPKLSLYDFAISNVYPHPLKQVKAKQTCLWLHNPMNKWSRFRKCIFGILRYNPSAVFLSQQQYRITPKLIPYKSRHIIEHGIEDIFLNNRKHRIPPENLIAIFASAPHRNLDTVLEVWKKYIHPNLKEAELHIYCDKNLRPDHPEWHHHNIKQKDRVPHTELANIYFNSRCLIYPGHEEETFCSVAHEATACGLPIVTQGIGVLSERVTPNVNGLIAKTHQQMAKAILNVLTDNEVWKNLHLGATNYPGFYTWENRAEIWENTFL